MNIQQPIAKGLIAGAVYAVIAVGFGLTFRVAKFFNLAYAALFSLSAYVAYVASHICHLSLWIAIPTGILAAVLVGVAIDRTIYSRMRSLKASSAVMLLISLGVLVVVQNVISFCFGDSPQPLIEQKSATAWTILGARLTSIQVVTIVTSGFLCLLVAVLLKWTGIGKKVRAISNDDELSLIVGIDRERITTFVFAVGSSLAAVAAILVGIDYDLTPSMGFKAILLGVVALIVGGLDRTSGCIVGGLFVGLVQQLTIWWLPSGFQEAILFCILVLFLIVRPEGIIGSRGKGLLI